MCGRVDVGGVGGCEYVNVWGVWMWVGWGGVSR